MGEIGRKWAIFSRWAVAESGSSGTVGKGAQRCLCDRKDEGPSSRMVASEAAVEVLATFPAVLVSAEGSRAPLDFSLRGTLVGELTL